MARANRDAIDTFMSITGASEDVALQRLEDHDGDLNEAVNAHFSAGDRNTTQRAPVAASQNDFMEIDDPIGLETREPPLPFLSSGRNLNPFSLLDPNFGRSFFESRGASEFSSRAPFVSHPREVREIPIEVKDVNDQPGHSGPAPTIEDVTGTAYAHGPETHGRVIIDDEVDEITPIDPLAHTEGHNERETSFSGNSLHQARVASAPDLDSDWSNDIEEEMVRAAIEASKREVEEGYPNRQLGIANDSSSPGIQQQTQSPLDDTDLAQAVSLSLRTAEQEKARREQGESVGAAQQHAFSPSDVGGLGKLPSTNERQGFGSLGKETSSQFKLEAGSSSVQDEAEDVDEQPLVRHRSRRISFGSMESAKDDGEMSDSPPSSPRPHDVGTDQERNRENFPSDEWGGISSEEHDEAVMLEAALFGRIPEGTAYRFDVGSYPLRTPRPPSPTLAAQRLLREQQDDEYLASLQADREKELKAREEAEARRLEEEAAREAALEEERRKEEEARMKLLEEEEFERQLAAKEASLPQEPASDDENAVTLLVRMSDGSRRGRRFLKSDKLQSLFDFIDVGRGVKPGTYKLVRPYPRRAFSDGESGLSLGELGLTSKQEALFIELI
ncbi:plant UBX domain-containing protein 8 [Telopea speciosissima]|uniref:plant UBX domain-containing protein 8 n=1 Tax=Telopea speciosissima TaxID=54955 RepID=UPI001CC45D49|nr:plant UBX domain-containing protein 8 [Telopea speciosissima]